MLKFALILVLLPAFIHGGRVTVLPCSGGGATPIWAEIDGCDESQCQIVNGSAVTFRASHTAPNGATSLTTTLTAFIGILPLPQTLPDNVVNGCQTVTGGCPIAAGETRDIGATFVVQAALSNVSPAIEYRKVNQDGTAFVCARININLIG